MCERIARFEDRKERFGMDQVTVDGRHLRIARTSIRKANVKCFPKDKANLEKNQKMCK